MPSFRPNDQKQYHGPAMPNLTMASAANSAAAPTMAEFNALRADVVALVARANAVAAVLKDQGAV